MINSAFRKILHCFKQLLGIAGADSLLTRRDSILREYIRGDGLELGALHNPMKLPPGAHASYVDRMSVGDLRKQYPELNDKKLINVDIIADGERLAPIPDCSQDFVIANHFLEHCRNPISAIENMLRVLKEAGVLLLTVPDKRFTFDKARQATSYEHLLKDYAGGPDGSKAEHFTEWAKVVDNVPDELLAERAGHLMAIDYSIHFHVWTQTEIIELMLMLKKMFSFEIELIYQNKSEIIVVLKKTKAA
jgi:SAM-dependent methyltransferase